MSVSASSSWRAAPSDMSESTDASAPRETAATMAELLLTAVLMLLASPYSLTAGAHGFEGEEWVEAKKLAVESLGEGGPTRTVALGLLGVMAVYHLLKGARWEKSATRVGVAMTGAYLALGLVSVTWADDPSISLHRVGAAWIVGLACFGMASRWTWLDLVRLAFLASGLVTVVGIAVAIHYGQFRPWESGYRLAPMIHPNRAAQDFAILMLSSGFLALWARRGAALYWTGMLGGAACLFLTRSRTAALSAVVAVGVVVALGAARRHVVPLVILSLAFGLTLFLLVPDLGQQGRELLNMGRSQTVDDITTLTGRSFIWQAAYSFFLRRPLLGYGFGSFWIPSRIDAMAAMLGWVMVHGHSGYVDAAMGLGAAGLALYVAMLWGGLAGAVRQFLGTRNEAVLFGVGVITFVAVCSLAESFFPAANLPSFVCLMALARLGFSDTVRVPATSRLYETVVLAGGRTPGVGSPPEEAPA